MPRIAKLTWFIGSAAEQERAMARWLDPTTGPGREAERLRICSRAQLEPGSSWTVISDWARERAKQEKESKKAKAAAGAEVI